MKVRKAPKDQPKERERKTRRRTYRTAIGAATVSEAGPRTGLTGETATLRIRRRNQGKYHEYPWTTSSWHRRASERRSIP